MSLPGEDKISLLLNAEPGEVNTNEAGYQKMMSG